MEAFELGQSNIKPVLRTLLRPVVSPPVFQYARFQWWLFFSYFPRLVVSRFVRRVSQVRGFTSTLAPSALAERLQNVNVVAPTRMCRVMTRCGSDKARAHKYTAIYSALLKSRYGQRLRIVELGLGTNNPDAPSTMGVFALPGASLRGWRELFPQSLVYGADIDRNILFQENRIKTFYCNQLDTSSIRGLWSQPDLQDGADIIIDDGLHTLEANVSFLENSLEYLRPGGFYITEDILREAVGAWYDRLETIYSKRYPEFEFAFVALPDRENQDHNLLVAYRRES